MKTCDNCQNAFYTTAQEGIAKEKGIAVDWLPYKYCSLFHAYTAKSNMCANHEPKHELQNENVRP